jgi:hypothetical protein
VREGERERDGENEGNLPHSPLRSLPLRRETPLRITTQSLHRKLCRNAPRKAPRKRCCRAVLCSMEPQQAAASRTRYLIRPRLQTGTGTSTEFLAAPRSQ